MENATKALLIAGGVLIAIIIITLLVRTYGNISNFQRQQLTQEEARQIAEFNSEYTQYAGQYIYGTDVITIINKTTNHNKQNENVNITVEIVFTLDEYTYTIEYWQFGKIVKKEKTIKAGNTLILKGDDDKYAFVSDENVDQLRSRAFKCDTVEDQNNDGVIDYIKLTEKAYQVPTN